jgi:hypothetical protein
MPEYQPIDYRLRCHSKRNDLPADVLRDIGEAYTEINRLNRDYHALKLRLEHIKEGFEGCCNTCEPVGEMNKKLREERDEARRMWCEAAPVGNSLSVNDMDRRARAEATRRGWDCFKENTDD